MCDSCDNHQGIMLVNLTLDLNIHKLHEFLFGRTDHYHKFHTQRYFEGNKFQLHIKNVLISLFMLIIYISFKF